MPSGPTEPAGSQGASPQGSHHRTFPTSHFLLCALHSVPHLVPKRLRNSFQYNPEGESSMMGSGQTRHDGERATSPCDRRGRTTLWVELPGSKCKTCSRPSTSPHTGAPEDFCLNIFSLSNWTVISLHRQKVPELTLVLLKGHGPQGPGWRSLRPGPQASRLRPHICTGMSYTCRSVREPVGLLLGVCLTQRVVL